MLLPSTAASVLLRQSLACKWALPAKASQSLTLLYVCYAVVRQEVDVYLSGRP